MEKNIPRIMLSAPKSGDGKTTVTCALLQALVNRGLNVSSFKCGPDYIDPMFHSEVIGSNGTNIDLFFSDENTAKNLFFESSKNSDIAVIEGAMGFYDGLGGISEKTSAYDVSKTLDIPVILVINSRGASLSLCAEINGFKAFRKDTKIAGVILNKCSSMLFKTLKPVIEKECKITVFGFLPENKDFSFESRHLGLVTTKEIDDIKSKLFLLSKEAEKSIDIDLILEESKEVKPISFSKIEIKKITENSPKIAVAKDKAFCFYYKENIELLEKLGAKIVYFSPLNDYSLPDEIDGIYIGGGYPELYLNELSANISMINSIKIHAKSSTPILAECGGFMYLSKEIEGIKMCSVLDGKITNTKKLSRFGYINITANDDNLLCKKGEKISAHEFHYFDSTENGNSFKAEKPINKRSWDCIVSNKNIFAGFPHLYFYNNISFAENFVKKCEENKLKRSSKK